ncbi:MAG TPA: alpha/beta fold hydrolase [Acidimicrobiales bacterium]|nr:alpha/beta fold hydrolase [Acidimicrobiales bacterium]
MATLMLISAGTAAAATWIVLSRRASATESSPSGRSAASTLPPLQIPNFGLVPSTGPANAHPTDTRPVAPSVLTPKSPGTPISTAVPTTTSTTDPTVTDAFYQTPDPLIAAPPGTVIRSERIVDQVGLPPLAVAYRVLYHSVSPTGADVAVSGTVVIPGQPSPAGGYPIATWAHATDGLADQCAPSIAGAQTVPYLAQLLDEGLIVAATDYQGLGTQGIPAYLVGQSEGEAVLDAARAARNLVDGAASDSVIIFGHSQGGQAALFAGQISDTYAPDLFVVGVVAAAPVSDVADFAPAVPGGAADTLSTYAVMAFYSWSLTYGDLPLDTIFTPEAIATAATLEQVCSDQVAATYAHLPTNQIFLPTWKDSAAIQAHLTQNEPGLAHTSAPILVVQGTDDAIIPYATTTTLVNQRLCRTQHDVVQYEALKGANHGTVVEVAQSDVLRWIAARFAGQPAPNSCG